MMSQLDNARVVFVDGVAIDDGNARIFIGGAFADVGTNASRMILLTKDDKWMTHDVRTRVVAVHACPSPFELYGLGRDGLVSIATAMDVQWERIATSGTGTGKLGYLKHIRRIAGDLYVCGHRHQVYKRIGNDWRLISREILRSDQPAVGYNLNAMDGIAPDNIYAVGDRGLVFHYDGQTWKDIDSPTNVSLEQILYISEHEMYVCGAQGTVMTGSGGTWRIIDHDSFTANIWGMAYFGGSIFLATPNNIFEWNGTDMLDATPDVGFDGHFNRLSASETHLWAIGINDIACFDGGSWSRVIYPGNI
jgi:hypothetical protein